VPDAVPDAVLGAELIRELDTVPEMDRFATVDQIAADLERLAADHPGVASLHRIGTSRLGDPLMCLTVGDGPLGALVVAMPHPNEPIGGLTAVHLARRMCEDAEARASAGYTWHIVGCVDPDGSRLNEGWFGGPFTPGHYGRWFYRPAGDEQAEWTFPFAYKRAYFDRVLPETLAWMRLIDDVRPDLMTSLHNSERGGVFYYVNRPEATLFPALRALPHRYGLPLHRGDPEHPSVRRLDDAIFLTPETRHAYDYLERMGQEFDGQIGGASSAEYAARYDTFTIAVELPYWRDETAGDHSPAGSGYPEVLRAQVADIRDLVGVLRRVLEAVGGDLVSDSPFLRATRYFTPLLEGTLALDEQRAAEPGNDRLATVAERQSSRDVVHSCRLRYAGMLLRALEAEIGVGNGTPAIRRNRDALAEVYAGWVEEAESATADETIPIRHLVSIQYGTILAAARHARGRRREHR
jgi:hypothetical protein